MTVDKVIANIIWLTFFWPTLYVESQSHGAQNVTRKYACRIYGPSAST